MLSSFSKYKHILVLIHCFAHGDVETGQPGVVRQLIAGGGRDGHKLAVHAVGSQRPAPVIVGGGEVHTIVDHHARDALTVVIDHTSCEGEDMV